MTRDDILRMANEAWGPLGVCLNEDPVMRFAALVAAAEREECAKVCDSETLIQYGEFGAGWVAGAKASAAAIRARQ